MFTNSIWCFPISLRLSMPDQWNVWGREYYIHMYLSLSVELWANWWAMLISYDLKITLNWLKIQDILLNLDSELEPTIWMDWILSCLLPWLWHITKFEFHGGNSKYHQCIGLRKGKMHSNNDRFVCNLKQKVRTLSNIYCLDQALSISHQEIN